MTYQFTIAVSDPTATSGQCRIGGHELPFDPTRLPSHETHPLHYAAVERYLIDGTTTGRVILSVQPE